MLTVKSALVAGSALCLSLGLAMAAPASARQSDEADAQFARIETAVARANAGDWDEAFEILDAVRSEAEQEDVRFSATATMAQLYEGRRRHAQAVALYHEAIGIIETPDQNSRSILVSLANRIGNIHYNNRDYQSAGEIRDLIAQILARPDLTTWREVDGEREHRLSALSCPEVEGLRRQRYFTYSRQSSDVGCDYAMDGDANATVTLHATYVTTMSEQEIFDGVRSAITQAHGGGELGETRTVMIGDAEVLRATDRTGDGRTAETWLHNIGDWSFKLRFTHYGRVDAETIETMGAAALAALPEAARHHDNCRAYQGDTGEIAPPAADFGLTSGLMVRPSPAGPGGTVDGRQCILTSVPLWGDQPLVLALRDNGTPAYLQVFSGEVAELRISPLLLSAFTENLEDGLQPDGEPRPLDFAATIHQIDSSYVLARYEGWPTVDAVHALAGQLANGEVQPITTISWQDGNPVISVNPDFFTDAAEDEAAGLKD